MTDSKILLFEADPALRYSRNRMLMGEGHRVSDTASVEETAASARREPFELLITSVENPDLFNMLISQFPPSLSILVLAERGIADKLVENYGGSFISFLFSPFSPAGFRKAVRQALNRTRMLRESIRNEVLNDLGALNHKLTIEPGIEKFMDTIVKINAVTTRADYVSMIAYGDDTLEPIIRSEAGQYNHAWDRIFSLLSEISDPVIISEDSQFYTGILDLMKEGGISSILHVPLVIKGEYLGTVTGIRIAGNGHFMDSDLSFVSILAWWTSMAIENTRVYLDYYKERLYANRLLDHISFAQENERKRVAIDIHDGVAQWLVGASYDVRLCSRLIADSNYTELENTLDKVKNVLQKSVQELRRAIANLPLPPLEELGMSGSIHRMLQKLEEDGIKSLVKIPEKLPALTMAQEKTFYWLIQESLNNIRKHSNASIVNFQINVADDTLSICISDNGVGFDVDRVMKSNLTLEHIGLMGMKERAEFLNGYIDIDSSPGKGTSVNMSFSLLPQEVNSIARA